MKSIDSALGYSTVSELWIINFPFFLKLLSFYAYFRQTHHYIDCYTRPVARFWGLEGQNTFLGGHDFCFYCTFKTNFSGNNKILGSRQKFGGALPQNTPPWLRACVTRVLRKPVRWFRVKCTFISVLKSGSDQARLPNMVFLRQRENSTYTIMPKLPCSNSNPCRAVLSHCSRSSRGSCCSSLKHRHLVQDQSSPNSHSSQ